MGLWRRMAPGGFLTGIAAVGAALLMLAPAACSSPEPLRGTELRPAREATPIELQNQFGQRVSLAGHSGRVVLLTFLYTSCPDVCPIVTSQLRDTHDLLGGHADEVAFVAVSVDPERDSVPAALAYSERWGMTRRWDYLVGSEEELSPIWAAYYVAHVVVGDAGGDDGHISSGSGQAAGVQGPKQAIPESYQVVHSAPVYLIDRKGYVREVFTPPLEAEDLAHDIMALLD